MKNMYLFRCEKDFILNQKIIFQIGQIFVEFENKKVVACNEVGCGLVFYKEADKITNGTHFS